jgi:hypothetical protein
MKATKGVAAIRRVLEILYERQAADIAQREHQQHVEQVFEDRRSGADRSLGLRRGLLGEVGVRLLGPLDALGCRSWCVLKAGSVLRV